MSARIRILCVDDHPIIREGLIAIVGLQPDMEIVGDAGSGAEALALFPTAMPDIVIVDLRLKDMTGFELIETLRTRAPAVRTIVLSSYEGDADVARALAAGALGYVVKGMVREELLVAIRTVHAGGRHVAAEVAQRLAEQHGAERLTPREVEVLELVAKGLRNKEIAASLGIAEDTVKMHLKRILSRLDVSDRTEAVTTALRRGIIHLN